MPGQCFSSEAPLRGLFRGAAVHGHYPDVERGHLGMGRAYAKASPGGFGKQPCPAARLELVVSGS